MRTTMPPVASQTVGDWFVVDTELSAFALAYFVSVQQGSTLTYKVQHGWTGDKDRRIQVLSLTRSTTTATLTVENAITPKVGDSIIVEGAGAPFDGTFDIASVTSSKVVTYTVANSGPTSATGGIFVTIIRTIDDPVITGKTSSAESNIAFPCSYIRLNVTSFSGGAAVLTVIQPSGN